MGNLANEMANRGSKLCMQICVNNIEDDVDRNNRVVRLSRKHLLDKKIGHGEINWISPLAEELFVEYELAKLPLEKVAALGLQGVSWNFWPNRGKTPQWDAIGISEDGTLVLVEAKAHISEIERTHCTAVSPESIEIIRKRIRDVMGDDEIWFKGYYQTANRLVHLNHLCKSGKKVLFVYLIFVNDVSMPKSESQTEWEAYLDAFEKKHPKPDHLKPYMKTVFVDLWKETGL